MKKLLTILLTLFLFSSAYAEARVVDKLEYRDGIAYAVGESEGYSGKLVTTYSNGKKETEINYQDGKQEGLDIWWWRNGNKGRESNYKNGKLNGLETEWYKGGIKQIETNYKDGEKHGLETRWNRNSVKQRETNYTAKQVININISQVVEEQIALLGSEADLNHLDVSEVTDMAGLFEWSDFNGDISKWDVSNVTNMSEMFKSSQFKGDISKWGISNVTDMSGMFSSSQFNSDISKWDVSSVTNMDGMFKDSQFSNDISKWDVSNVTDTEGMYFQSKIVSNARPPSHSNDFKSSSNLIAYRRLNLAQYNEKDKDYARYKSRLIEKPIITKLLDNEFVLHPYLEYKYADEFTIAETLSNSKDKDEKKQGFTELRELARAGMQNAYIALMFDHYPGVRSLVGNLFDAPMLFKRRGITIPSNVSEKVDLNSNKLPDQYELFRRFLILSQKKYQIYNWVIERGGDEVLPLAYKVFSESRVEDEIAELQLVMRATQEELKPIRKYLNSDKDILEGVERLAKNGDTLAVIILMEIYHPSDMLKKSLNLEDFKIFNEDNEKAKFYARLALNKLPDKERSARRKAYLILEELK